MLFVYLNTNMALTEEQIDVLKKRKKELETYNIVGIIIVVVFAVIVGFLGVNLYTIVLAIAIFTAFPSYWTRKKELTEIEFKLASINIEENNNEEVVKLINFIKSQKKKGKKNKEIKELLINKGLDKEITEKLLEKD